MQAATDYKCNRKKLTSNETYVENSRTIFIANINYKENNDSIGKHIVNHLNQEYMVNRCNKK